MGRVIDIYVCARAGVGSLYLLVAGSSAFAAEADVDGHTFDDLVDVVLLFLVVVLSWPGHFCERLPRVWRLPFVLPEVSSLGFCEE